MDRLLTPAEVGELLQLSEQAVTNLLRNGELEGRKIRGKWRVTTEELNAYVNKGKERA